MPVHSEAEGRIATLTIDRPAELNALDYRTIDELSSSLRDLEADDAIRAVDPDRVGRSGMETGTGDDPHR